METITFYSYKGGVGRTLALANISKYLSRFGQNVCIVDFDLEAPGIHYKFSQDTEAINKGLLDFIFEFTIQKEFPNSLEEYSLEITPKLRDRGFIRLIPAGNVLSSNYWRKLALLDWHSLFYEEDSEGILFFLEFKEKIKKEFKPDILLIDSRTGITEMSSLCTSLLPDKVVFFIVNNKENIEGARQIFKAIQNAERLPGQKPINTIFALSRLPLVESEIENNIILDIKNNLNIEIANNNENNIIDIFVLHSDRDLELSETLMLDQGFYNQKQDTPLLKDYLRLFSKITSESIFIEKISTVIEEIITPKNLLEDPDKTQKELENLIEVFPHRVSLQRLIEFYFLRNEKIDKILNIFHKLWDIFGINDLKTLNKYKQCFLSASNYTWEVKKFNLDIIEEYLKFEPEDIYVEYKLAESYKNINNNVIALQHYYRVIDNLKDNNKAIEDIIDIYIKEKLFTEAEKFIQRYEEIIDNNYLLKAKKIIYLKESGRIEEALLSFNNKELENTLLEKYPVLFVKIIFDLNIFDNYEMFIIDKINNLIINRNNGELIKIGNIFYSYGRKDLFKQLISNYIESVEIISHLNKYTIF